ncbi:MAG: protein of unknown function DUF1624 [uncultured bacterium (gcode 4)]|uniref:Heparan-alpha-glucosaminide N-acetyltransferase catalytic domain-containing protein n=1 Tax=uncultured bacterium (gcode 4) TaxID=1234023 RepID=K2H2A5_9BACT|nr:MAG: protein of unknown function DUF1624 [uncultured bacterium (gcode 4)]
MRYRLLDVFRWGFVLGMIFFHFNFMMVNYFSNYTFENVAFWVNLQYFGKIWFLFLSWLAFSLAELKYKSQIGVVYLKKSLNIWLLALMITLASVILSKDSPIYFWILHYFIVSYVLLLPLRHIKYWNLPIWIILVIIWIYIEKMTFSSWAFFILWFRPAWFDYLDYFPLMPNFWYALIGYCTGLWLIRSDFIRTLRTSPKILKPIEILWKKSLLIYIIHTPIIYSLIWIIYFFGLIR